MSLKNKCAIVAAAGLLQFLIPAGRIAATSLLIPMDLAQTDHLRAYGVVFHGLSHGIKFEWLLNYRGGSFLTGGASPLLKTLLQRIVS